MRKRKPVTNWNMLELNYLVKILNFFVNREYHKVRLVRFIVIYGMLYSVYVLSILSFFIMFNIFILGVCNLTRILVTLFINIFLVRLYLKFIIACYKIFPTKIYKGLLYFIKECN